MTKDEFDEEFGPESEDEEGKDDWENELVEFSKSAMTGNLEWHNYMNGKADLPEMLKLENISVRDYKDKKMKGKKFLIAEVFERGKKDSHREMLSVPQQFATQLKTQLGNDWENNLHDKHILLVNYGMGIIEEDKKTAEKTFVNTGHIQGESFYNIRIKVKG